MLRVRFGDLALRQTQPVTGRVLDGTCKLFSVEFLTLSDFHSAARLRSSTHPKTESPRVGIDAPGASPGHAGIRMKIIEMPFPTEGWQFIPIT